jgi:hypothetical protein
MLLKIVFVIHLSCLISQICLLSGFYTPLAPLKRGTRLYKHRINRVLIKKYFPIILYIPLASLTPVYILLKSLNLRFREGNVSVLIFTIRIYTNLLLCTIMIIYGPSSPLERGMRLNKHRINRVLIKKNIL